MTNLSWNPRYMAYCLAHGLSDPAVMLERDRICWPGGHMCGFMLWIQDRWQIWKRETGWRGPILWTSDHHAFDRWLNISIAASVECSQ